MYGLLHPQRQLLFSCSAQFFPLLQDCSPTCSRPDSLLCASDSKLHLSLCFPGPIPVKFPGLTPGSCLLSPAASLHFLASMILESFFWMEFLICFSLSLNCSSTSLCHKVSFWLLKSPLCPWGPLHRLHSLSALV